MIRVAEEKDIDKIIDLLHQVLHVHAMGRSDLFIDNTTKYTVSELKEMLDDENNPIFVYEDENDGVVGYAFCNLLETKNSNNMYNHKTLFIDDFCIDEQHQNKHIGKALYEYVENYARKIDCYNVTLNVWSCNPKAIAFYEACGLLPMKYVMEKIL